MSETMFLSVAIFVFAMMLVGLGLTVWEFMRGKPRAQDIANTAGIKRRESSTHRKAA